MRGLFRWPFDQLRVSCGRAILGFRFGEAGGGEELGVDDDEEAFGSGEDVAVGVLDFGLMEELAAFAAEVAAGED